MDDKGDLGLASILVLKGQSSRGPAVRMGHDCFSLGLFLQWLVRHLGLRHKVRGLLLGTYIALSMFLVFSVIGVPWGHLRKTNGCVGSNKMNKPLQERDELILDFWYRIKRINIY